MQSNEAHQVLAILDWLREMGADEVVGSSPQNWLSQQPRAPGADQLNALKQQFPALAPKGPTDQTPIKSPPNLPASAVLPPPASSQPRSHVPSTKSPHPNTNTPPRSFQNAPPDTSLAAANEAATSAASLEALHEKLRAFDGCGLKATAKNTCFYRGAPSAKVMIIGEAPGRDEDLEGRPFVGRAGQLLDRMLKAIDLDENDVHITNIVYWRPPGNRTPTVQEARVCRPFLDQQIKLVSPQIIVVLGGAAAKNLLETDQGIMRLRGKWQERTLAGTPRQILATLHPAYLLRTPAAKRLAWRDFLNAKLTLGA